MLRRLLISTLSLMALASGATAQSTFHLKEFDYKRGEWTFENINAANSGFPARADRIRAAHELGLGFALTDWWQPKVLVAFDTEAIDGADYQLRRVLFENVFKLAPLAEEKDGIGAAWFHAVEWGVHRGETNASIFGPILTAQAGKFSATVNPFAVKTFGNHREPGWDFYLAWQGRYEIADKIKIGIEGYTTWPELGASSAASAGVQNRIGPVVIFEFDIPGFKGGAGTPATHGTSAVPSVRGASHGQHAELELGVLFGTTDATQDVTGKVNLHVSF
jgi:hypothetical protein